MKQIDLPSIIYVDFAFDELEARFEMEALPLATPNLNWYNCFGPDEF